MSQTAIVVQGFVRADGTLELVDKLNVPAGRVQVVIQPLPDVSAGTFLERMEAIWAGRSARGHVPRSVEQIESERRALREETDEEIQQAIRLQEECRSNRSDADGPGEQSE
jgi:hypothetical protein